jgi:hypothetical protein
MKRKKGIIGTPTSVFSLTPKERGQFFSEKAKEEETVFDINYWGMDSFKLTYHSKFGKIPCPPNILKKFRKIYNEQGIILPKR